jgi:hypothetical protein
VRAGDPVAPLNSCYVSLCRQESDGLALVALLNSRLAQAWLAALAESARGGYRRYFGWTMSLFPLPRDWSRARQILEPISLAAFRGQCTPSHSDLLEACLDAYRLRQRDIEPLLAWFGS